MSAQARANKGVGMSRWARKASIARTVNSAVMAKFRPAMCSGMTVPSTAPMVAPVTQQAWMNACSHRMRPLGQDRAVSPTVSA